MTKTHAFLAAAWLVAVGFGLGACAAGEPPAPADVPAGTPPERPPAVAGEKMTLERQVLAAKAELARRLGVSPDDIEVVDAREVTWPDASVGCPEPGMMYAQVLTPGVLIVLSAQGEQIRFHARLSAVPVPCPADRVRDPAAAPPGS